MGITALAFSFLLFCSNLIPFVNPDVFSAVCKLEIFAVEEAKMIRALEQYVRESQAEECTVPDSVFSFLTQVKDLNRESLTPHFSENPINAFRLVRRGFLDWNHIFQDINCDDCVETQPIKRLNSTIVEIQLSSSSAQVTMADCEGAAVALIRLWQTYRLELSQLFRQIISGMTSIDESMNSFSQALDGQIRDQQTTPLSPSEILYITQVADDRHMYYQEILWLEELSHLMLTSQIQSDGRIRTAVIFKRLASAYFMNGMPWESVRVLKTYLEEDPDHKTVQRDLKFYELKVESIQPDMRTKTLQPEQKDLNKAHYEALCRGDVKRPISVTSQLKCFFRKTSIPFYFGKEEVLNYDPRVSMYHDVITDDEQRFLRNMVLSKFDRSTIVGDSSNPNIINDDKRVSQTAWLADNVHPLIRRVTRRVQLVTGLSTEIKAQRTDAEELQVLNYGIGGMYEPHPDWFGGPDLRTIVRPKDPVEIQLSGDRVATWLFYLNSVDAGGATVFVKLNITVPVVKGAAAFWYNMYRNGHVDKRTWHAGCPVLLGSKWVANKWIRETGQMFRRKCGLSPDAGDGPFR